MVCSCNCLGQCKNIRKINKKNHTKNLHRSCENLKFNDISACSYNKPAQNAFKAMRCWYEVITEKLVEVLSLMYCGLLCLFQFASMVTVATSPAWLPFSSQHFLLMKDTLLLVAISFTHLAGSLKTITQHNYINYCSSEYWSTEKFRFRLEFLPPFTFLLYWNISLFI